MTASNHGRHLLARIILAAGGIAVFLAVCGAADLAARHYGTLAGVAVISGVFAACWAFRRVRPLLHPVSLARRSGVRDADVTAEAPVLAGTAATG